MKIGNYEFELRSFNYLASLSKETYCFGAVLYVNGKKFADCGNSGKGGPTDVHILPQCEALGTEVEAFLRTQPKIKYGDDGFELDCDLEYIVNELVEEVLNKRERQKLMAKTKTNLLFQGSDGGYYQIKWKITITEVLKTAWGPKAIRTAIAKEIEKGSVLLNENIPADLLPEAK